MQKEAQVGSQKITPFLWFEKDMKGVLNFYSSVFPGTKVLSGGELNGTPSGQVQTASLKIYDVEFNFMTAGPYLPFNPTVSFIIACENKEEVDDIWGKLIGKEDGGRALMPLQAYPFAEWYGWAQDKYGVSWQIMYSSSIKSPQKVIPTIMFAGDVCGKAGEALDFYTKVFHNSKVNYVMKYDEGDKEIVDSNGVIKHAGFTIENFFIALMDNKKKSPLNFKQAISFVVSCKDQEEVDYYWNKLSEGGEEIQCGWLNDKFGFPWQVVPACLGEMLEKGNPEQVSAVTQAFMKMKKFNVSELEKAFNGAR